MNSLTERGQPPLYSRTLQVLPLASSNTLEICRLDDADRPEGREIDIRSLL